MENECFICTTPECHHISRTCGGCREMIERNEMLIYKKVQVHVAHMLPGHVTCGKIHGHTVDIVIGIKGTMDHTTGMVMDFKYLKEILQKEIVDRFDHGCLNDIIPMPTAEYLAAYIYFQLNHRRLNVVMVRVHETDNNYVEFRGDGDV